MIWFDLNHHDHDLVHHMWESSTSQSHAYLRYASVSRSLLPYNRSLLARTHTSGMLVLVGLFCRIIGLFCHRNRSLLTLTHTSGMIEWVGLFCHTSRSSLSKETYSYVKRDLFLCQKRLIPMSKETYSYVKRDLFLCQKRPIPMSKETYSDWVSRPLLPYQ